ncbi:MAG: tRNA uridine-5-carboxymethylaminomethyl(34) synthesis enzyme MnmG, partial [Verrucomicrobiales bacterium]
KMARQESKRIPSGVDFHTIRGLKIEARQRFADLQPATLGQAGRIPGITPADVAVLAVWLEKGSPSTEGCESSEEGGAALK